MGKCFSAVVISLQSNLLEIKRLTQGATVDLSLSSTTLNCTNTTSTDTCILRCDLTEPKIITKASCGDAGTCIVECSEQKCMIEGDLDASNVANNLTFRVTGQECVKLAHVWLPNTGNATFENEQTKGFKGLFVHAGNYTQNIIIDCTDPDTGTGDDCKGLTVYAKQAEYLEITSGDGGEIEHDGATGLDYGVIECPEGNTYNGPEIAPCIIDISGGGLLKGYHIWAKDGIPEDVWIKTGSITLDTVDIDCDAGSSPNSGNTFSDTSACWNSPIPTTSPTGTLSPSAVPSGTPSVAPSQSTAAPSQPTSAPSDPTAAPSTAPSQPTTSPSDVTSSPSEATSSPTSAPSDATSSPSEATSSPSTFSPTITQSPSVSTAAPTGVTSLPTDATSSPSEATSSPTEATASPTESTATPSSLPSTALPSVSPVQEGAYIPPPSVSTESPGGNLGTDTSGLNGAMIGIIIGASVCGVLCIVILIIVMIKRKKKDKIDEEDDDVFAELPNQSENVFGGLGSNQLFAVRSKSLVNSDTEAKPQQGVNERQERAQTVPMNPMYQQMQAQQMMNQGANDGFGAMAAQMQYGQMQQSMTNSTRLSNVPMQQMNMKYQSVDSMTMSNTNMYNTNQMNMYYAQSMTNPNVEMAEGNDTEDYTMPAPHSLPNSLPPVPPAPVDEAQGAFGAVAVNEPSDENDNLDYEPSEPSDENDDNLDYVEEKEAMVPPEIMVQPTQMVVDPSPMVGDDNEVEVVDTLSMIVHQHKVRESQSLDMERMALQMQQEQVDGYVANNGGDDEEYEYEDEYEEEESDEDDDDDGYDLYTPVPND